MADQAIVPTTTHPQQGTEEQYKRAHKINERVIALKGEIEQRFLEMGKVLSIINRAEIFKFLGYETFGAYLAQPQLDLSKATAYRMMDAYSTFVERNILPESDLIDIGVTKAAMIARYWRSDVESTPEEQSDWIASARELSVGDLRKLMRRHANGINGGAGEQRLAALEEFAERLNTLVHRLPQTRDIRLWLADLYSLQVDIGAWADTQEVAGGVVIDAQPVAETEDDAHLRDDPVGPSGRLWVPGDAPGSADSGELLRRDADAGAVTWEATSTTMNAGGND